jgi:hypothetical protein
MQRHLVCDRSIALPLLNANDITRFLALRFSKTETQTPIGENSLVKQFRQWLKSQKMNEY